MYSIRCSADSSKMVRDSVCQVNFSFSETCVLPYAAVTVTLQTATKLPSLVITITSAVPAATPVTVIALPLTVTVAFAPSEVATRNEVSEALAGLTVTLSVVVAPTATLAVALSSVTPVTGIFGVPLSSASSGLPVLVIFAVRVMTSFAGMALPKLLHQPRKTSTVPFGYLIL